jgi:MFS family permease
MISAVCDKPARDIIADYLERRKNMGCTKNEEYGAVEPPCRLYLEIPMTQTSNQTNPQTRTHWLNREVLLLSFSACFADLGYQAVLAIFPLFLVWSLHAHVWLFALATAISYGPGAIFGLVGGKLGDRFGHKRMAIGGNLLIPLLSLSGLASIPAAAIALFSGGWWARNFRSPPRRTMMTQAASPENRARAFGFLHALDIGGGFLAATGTMLLLWSGMPLRHIFLITIIPLLISSLVLSFARTGAAPHAGTNGNSSGTPAPPAPAVMDPKHRSLYRRLLLATALYGFSSFSFGFPILTVYQSLQNRPMAVLAYVVFFGISALTGLLIGRTAKRSVPALALGGYLLGGVAAAGMAVVWATHLNPVLFYPVVALMGLALGVIETLEPTIISLIMPVSRTGGGMGALTATRSVGLFAANLIMGLLYIGKTWAWSYGYAALLAVLAAIILLSVRHVEPNTAA